MPIAQNADLRARMRMAKDDQFQLRRARSGDARYVMLILAEPLEQSASRKVPGRAAGQNQAFCRRPANLIEGARAEAQRRPPFGVSGARDLHEPPVPIPVADKEKAIWAVERLVERDKVMDGAGRRIDDPHHIVRRALPKPKIICRGQAGGEGQWKQRGGEAPRLHQPCFWIHCSTIGAIFVRHLEPLKMP